MFHSLLFAVMIPLAAVTSSAPFGIENDAVRYEIGEDGQNVLLLHKPSGRNLLAESPGPCASIQKGGQTYPASQVRAQGNDLCIGFGASGVEVVIRPHAESAFLTLEVVSVQGDGVDTLTFLNVPLRTEQTVAGCALALNLKTNVPELPGPMLTLSAISYKRFGFEGAKVVLLVSPPETLRETMKEAAKSSDDIPRSLLGGPWALDAPIARGSYLIDMNGQLGENTADAWVRLAKDMGLGQIDFHTGKTMRFGDLAPNPAFYPNGLDGVKSVVDKLHEAGIQAGLHTYAFYMAKDSEWVSPKPDARLAADRSFTLAEVVDASTNVLPLAESPAGISAVTGFQVRNSATVRIDDELITFEGVSAEPPYAFTGCKRGAWGTVAAAHEKSAKVSHLKECFGLFAPDGDSTLFAEVAARTADVYNRCGFDMIYLDAIDGADLLAGGENAWYYAGKFVYELNKRLTRPALFEMSALTHHMWYARSRMGALDVPARAFNRFVDIHTLANEDCLRRFMPAHLGWWGSFDWSPVQPERTFPEDFEYLCGKSIGWNSGMSFFVGFTPDIWAVSSNIRRLGGIVKEYEDLRRSGGIPETTLAALRQRGQAFTLEKDGDTASFRRVYRAKHVIDSAETSSWTVANTQPPQTPRIRVEILMSAAPYDAPDAIQLCDNRDAGEFTEKTAQTGVTAAFAPAADPVKDGLPCAAFDATSGHPEPESAWALAGKTFPSLLNLADRALGVWVYGDGQKEILNVQLKNPAHINSAISEHYIKVDFTGWKYCLLVEPESDHIGDYGWPYSARQNLEGGKPVPFGDVILDYNMWVDYGHIASLNVYVNNLPINTPVRCAVSPVRALPLRPVEITNPCITVADAALTFPVTLKSGQYIEFRSLTDCAVYDNGGERIATITPTGVAPVLETGDNTVYFSCDALPPGAPVVRARVTTTILGDTLPVR